ncbi:uncharacterized protein TNCV_3064491 [Trichonephila clavipes]|nr:uncharacterized protein TNCV_3064491 [Trichonephila clavipes]
MYPSALLSSNLCHGICTIMTQELCLACPPAQQLTTIAYRVPGKRDFENDTFGESPVFHYPPLNPEKDAFSIVINEQTEAFLPHIKYPGKANDFIEYTYSRVDVAQREASKWVMDAQECQWVNYEQLFISQKKMFCMLLNMAFWKLPEVPLDMCDMVLNTQSKEYGSPRFDSYDRSRFEPKKYIPLDLGYVDVTGYEIFFQVTSPYSYSEAIKLYPYARPHAIMTTLNGTHLANILHFLQVRYHQLQSQFPHTDIVFGCKGNSYQMNILRQTKFPHLINVEIYGSPSMRLLTLMYPHIVADSCPWHVRSTNVLVLQPVYWHSTCFNNKAFCRSAICNFSVKCITSVSTKGVATPKVLVCHKSSN